MLALVVAGCRGTSRHPAERQAFAPPPWGGRGTALQDDLERFDPYPQTDVGPEVVGARPRNFENPRPEATRGRWWEPLSFKRWIPWLREP
jgi:hypothetical protein